MTEFIETEKATVRLRLSSDGVQYLAPVRRGRELVAIVAGPLDLVLATLPGLGVLYGDIEGIPDGFKRRFCEGKDPRPTLLLTGQ